MNIETVLVTGAGGYVGTLLVKNLLNSGLKVKAIDTFWFGNHLASHNNLEVIQHDLRKPLEAFILNNVDMVIHLACVSNDPSYELDPQFSDLINIKAAQKFIDTCCEANIKRFIYASSSSVYGIKNETTVSEELTLEPLTPYSQSKVVIENYLLARKKFFDLVILRPATLYGYSPRLRLDVVSNLLTAQAFFNKKITVFGGNQQRPQLHIDQMIRVYNRCVFEKSAFSGEIYNVGENNLTLNQIADVVVSLFEENILIEHLPTHDNRSYRISSHKIAERFNISFESNLKNGLNDLINYFKSTSSLDWQSPLYHNVKNLKQVLNHVRDSVETL